MSVDLKQQSETLEIGKTPRVVLRGVNSQNSANTVGIHWLRLTFKRMYLKQLRGYLDLIFGESKEDERGLWSYDTCYRWLSGVTLNYDSNHDRNERVHNGCVTLDCPGQSLDELACDDLYTFITGLRYWQPSCTRIDVFFDDYNRTVTPSDLVPIAKTGDYSRFRKTSIRQRYESGKLIHDEVSFGERGQNGSGKYLRIYDKLLESKGEFNCIRWECEFSGDRSHEIFDKLSKTASLTAFATLCGSLIGGSIVFVQRTGDKNISRLDMYDFWEKIIELLGSVVIRIKREDRTIDDVCDWVNEQVSPSLACLRSVFVNDVDFMNWLINVVNEGDFRLTKRHKQIIAKCSRKKSWNYFFGTERNYDDTEF